MPVMDPAQLEALLRKAIVSRQPQVPDSGNPMVRYAENRRTRTPTIFQPDVDPGNKIANQAGRYRQGVPGTIDPLELLMTGKSIPRWKIGGLMDSSKDPAEALTIARQQEPEGPGTTEAYDEMTRRLKNSYPARRGVIQIRAPYGAEEASPSTMKHEEGHAATQPFDQPLVEDAWNRFSLKPQAASEAAAYHYQGDKDPTGLTPLIEPLLKGLEDPNRPQGPLKPEQIKAIQRYRQAASRGIPQPVR